VSRQSTYLLPTLRDAPGDSESISHQLLVRAGMVRQVGSGLWTYLPAGWRIHRRIEQIIREEMNAIGGEEMLMPLLQPRDLWQKTGRDDIEEIFKLEDRKGADLVLAMTHEEAVTSHVAAEIRSYRELPKLLYQFQVKERDEPRPRAGILRTREFVMKDAYSFDRDAAGLEESYGRCIEAYDRIFDRAGLRWYRVESDVGMMGGSGAHEYMAPCPAGEDTVALADGYAANLEVASGHPDQIPVRGSGPESVTEISTPGLTTVEQVTKAVGVQPANLIKAVPVVPEAGGELVLAIVRGDDQVNLTKLSGHLGVVVRPAREEEIEANIGPVGYIGPVGAEVRVLKDEALGGAGLICGGNRPDIHLDGIEIGRDFDFVEADIRMVREGDRTAGGNRIQLEPAIEVGNIFKLGTRYSEALGATYLDEAGSEELIVMGSYGIGPARIMAAAAEQRADENGLVWPASIAPWDLSLVALTKEGEPGRESVDAVYEALLDSGVEVLYDDRDVGAGQKLTDAELIGCPLRVVAGKKSLARDVLEGTVRSDGAEVEIPLDDAVEAVTGLLAGLEQT
jgi:prolyl-tRNA synthetase